MTNILQNIEAKIDTPRAANWLNSIRSEVVIFCILCLCYLSFVPIANEEQYMQLAKQFVNPDWIKDSTNLSEFAGTRIIYQYIVGNVLKVLSFEQTVFAFRLIFIALFTTALSKLYRRLAFSNLTIITHLAILYLGQQSLFAGSWIFVTVEPKSFAYVSILFGLVNAINRDYLKFFLWCIAATYFHILVGFYATFFLSISLLLFNRKDRGTWGKLIKLGILYAVALVPLILYLQQAVEAPAQTSPSANWIYTYFRSPHHTAIFKDLSYFYQNHFLGVLLTFVGLYFCFRIRRVISSDALGMINTFAMISLLGTLLFVPVAFFDKEGVILKYYLFRINALSTFALTLVIASEAQKLGQYFKNKAVDFILIASFVSMFFLVFTNVWNMKLYYSNEQQQLREVCTYIKENTERTDVIFSLVDDAKISRLTERNLFAVYKFIPADFSRMYDWYERILRINKVREGAITMNQALEGSEVEYILTESDFRYTSDNAELLFENEHYSLFFFTE